MQSRKTDCSICFTHAEIQGVQPAEHDRNPPVPVQVGHPVGVEGPRRIGGQGDQVEIQEHSPISRDKRFIVVRLVKKFVEE